MADNIGASKGKALFSGILEGLRNVFVEIKNNLKVPQNPWLIFFLINKNALHEPLMNDGGFENLSWTTVFFQFC